MNNNFATGSSVPTMLIGILFFFVLCPFVIGFIADINSPMIEIQKNITVKDKVLLSSILIHNQPYVMDSDGNWYYLSGSASYFDFTVGTEVAVIVQEPLLSGDKTKDSLRMWNDTTITAIVGES